VIQLGELLMILELHRQGLSITAIARRTGRDPKTVRKYIERGLEPPAYGPRQVGRPNKLVSYLDYLRERIAAFPELTAVRLTREIRERGYSGAYTAVKRFVAAIRPTNQPKPFEVRFETAPGYQAQVDFARFVTTFTDEPEMNRIVWLFSLVLAIPGTSLRASSCIRICRRCCAVTCWPSVPLAECRSRSSTIA
jgi:transposase